MPLSSQPVAWYSCNESSGDRVSSAPGGPTMSEVGSSTPSAPGLIGNAALVNAGMGRLSGPAAFTFSPPATGPFSFAGFFRLTECGDNNDLFGHGDVSGVLNHSIGADGIQAFPQLGVVFVARDTTSGINSPDRYPLNAWHHVAAVSDGSTLKLYVNGTMVNSTPSVPDYTGITHLGVGFTPSALTFRADLLGVWPVAISPSDVSLLWNGGAGFEPDFAPAHVPGRWMTFGAPERRLRFAADPAIVKQGVAP